MDAKASSPASRSSNIRHKSKSDAPRVTSLTLFLHTIMVKPKHGAPLTPLGSSDTPKETPPSTHAHVMTAKLPPPPQPHTHTYIHEHTH